MWFWRWIVIMSKIFYIADLHFGCQNKYEGRTLEHDQLIIDNWNRVVSNNDKVYILGDIGRCGNNKDNEYLCKCISVLKGQKILITGNHEDLRDNRVKQLFAEIYDYKEITDNFDGRSYKVIMCHYPILFYNYQHKENTVHIYGHLHMSDEWELYKKCLREVNEYFMQQTLAGRTDCPQARAINVGCMIHDYTPRTLKELMIKNI